MLFYDFMPSGAHGVSFDTNHNFLPAYRHIREKKFFLVHPITYRYTDYAMKEVT